MSSRRIRGDLNAQLTGAHKYFSRQGFSRRESLLREIKPRMIKAGA